MIRRFGETPRTDQTYSPRPGAYAILPRAGRILLTHQAAPFSEFQLPGGGIDAGEHVLTALHREVMEETGWTIASPRKIGCHRRFVFMPDYDLWAEKICHIYLATPVLQRSAPTEAGHSSHWFDLQDAAHQIANPGDRHFLRQLFG